MKRNRSLWAILGVLAAVSAASCDDSKTTPLCGGDICTDGEVCNIVRDKCERVNVCGNACAEGEECDDFTGLCKTSCNNCNGLCNEFQTCDTASCTCVAGAACNNCGGLCNANQTCNTTLCKCENKPHVCNNCNGLCNEDQTCDTNSCTCKPKGSQTCNNCDGLCTGKQTCDTDSCTCACNNCNGQCTGDTVCDPDSCECVKDCNNCNGECGTDMQCDTKSCSCIPCNGLVYNNRCLAYANNCSPSCSDQYEICTVEGCRSPACAGMVWDEEQCFCSITGKLWEWADKTIPCGEAPAIECQEPDGNLVPNWSFENWDEDGLPEYWILHRNSTSSEGESAAAKISDPQTCKLAARFQNAESKVARLESDPIAVPENPVSGVNLKLACTAYLKGEGDVNLGYRGLDASGKKLGTYTNEAKKQVTLSQTPYYRDYSWEMSFDDSVKSFQVLIGLSEGDVQVDSVSCVVNDDNLCKGITCEHEWEICDVRNHKDPETGKFIGLCIPRPGRCSTAAETADENGEGGKDTCSEWEQCDPDEHVCKGVDGKCKTNLSCTDDAKPMCDTATHECVAATDEEICAKANCNEYRECSVATRGECVLKPGYCNTSADCTDDKPICFGSEHTCVTSDSAYTVATRKDCPLADDYFNYLNYVDEDPKKELLHETLVCPVNIVPNGGFEAWEIFRFTSTSTPHPVPAWWHAIKDYNNFVAAASNYLSEFSFDAFSEDKDHVHNGSSALRIQFTGDEAPRFTSWGFKVPGGTWDCSYWVRGTGDVRVITFSSAGEMPKTNFIHYDTDTWKRGTFDLRPAASDARVIIYVSHTTAARDHIQIDDVACTARGGWI